MRRLGHAGRGATGAVIIAAMTLQGCANAPSFLPTSLQADDPNDSCAPKRAPLKAIVEDYNDRFTRNVAVGALAGAGAGAAIGAANNNIVAGLLIGAVGGALVGAFATYYDKIQQQEQDQAKVRQIVSGDIKAARANVDGIGKAITELNQCRNNQIAELRRQIRAGAKGDAQKARAAEIRSWMDQDRQLIEAAIGDINSGNEIYKDAYAKSRDIETGKVAQRAQTYTPKVTKPKRDDRIPTRVSTRTPRASNEAEGLLLATANVKAVSNAQIEQNYESLDSAALLLN